MDVLLLTRDDVERLLTMDEVIDAVEDAFKQKGLGLVSMPPKVYVFFEKYNGDFRVMPAYLKGSNIAGVKVVNVHPDNPRKHSLPTVMATVVLLAPETGAPLAIIEGGLLTAYRTAAAGGVAIKYLARKDSRTLAVIGAGVQGRFQTLAAVRVARIEEVRVYDISREAMEAYAKEIEKQCGVDVKICDSVEEAAKGADIIVTATPARKPVLPANCVGEGVHINAIGADAPGKQELDPEILKRAKIVVDDIEQASHSGEINVPLREGILSLGDIYAELGDVVVGKKKGRESDEEITVFDSTGLAIQDVATGHLVYRKATEQGVGMKIKFF